jgi:hypothetical protein
MSDELSTTGCPPLMAACNLSLYEKNIFRVTELPVDATAKDVSRQAQKQQMLAEMGGGSSSVKAPFALRYPPNEDQIREALARMKTPEDRIVDEFFWFWPEEFGNSKSDPAIQAMLTGDSQKAADIWRAGEKEGSYTAIHNIAIMYHMAAVDWTIHQLKHVNSDESYEEVKGYWDRSFRRWEKVAGMEEIWDCMKHRVRSMDDEALTTGFIRRMRSELPMALDRVNAEAALAFAEMGDMEWAEYHVRLMNETHQGLDDVEATAELVLEPTRKRVRQYVDSAEEKVRGNRAKGAELANQLLGKCRPSMAIYDLFHGKEAHQRADLFDEVAACATSLVISYQIETGDNIRFVEILKTSLDFASSSSLREKIIKNLSIGENNLNSQKFEPIFEKLKSFSGSKLNPAQKLNRIKAEILPSLPSLAPAKGQISTAYNALLDSVAISLRAISIDAHNAHNDFATAESAIQIALRIAVSEDLKTRLRDDAAQVKKSVEASSCHFCGVTGCNGESSLDIAMHGDVQRSYGRVNFRKTTVSIPRCDACKKKHSNSESLGCGLAILAIIIGALIGGANDGNWIGGVIVGGILGFIFYLIYQFFTSFSNSANGCKKYEQHPAIVDMLRKGWIIGEKPN